MMDEISKKILSIIYGFGIREMKLQRGDQIPPHCSSSGLQAIFNDVPRTTFYRKLSLLEKEGYITISEKKRLSRNYEIINGQKIAIPTRYTRAREVKLTEKGKGMVSELLTNKFPQRIDILVNQKVKKVLFIDAIEYLNNNFGIEIHTALFHLLHHIEKKKLPVDLERLGKEIPKETI
jgi:hypothetical protein